MNGQAYEQTPVCFDDVRMHRPVILPSSGKHELYFFLYAFLYF